MHITLIQPSVGRKADGTPYPAAWRMEPLGIATLAGLTPAKIGRTFFDDRLEAIDYETPTDLVCITVETFTARRAYQIAAEFHRRGVRTVLGGFHATLLPDEAAAHADTVVIGEAESLWTELLDDASAGALKPSYQAASRPDLGNIAPDRSIFGNRNYGLVSLVETSRGCRFNCEFCSICRFFRHTCVNRPTGSVAREVGMLRKPVFFVDDNLGADPQRLRELCEALLPLRRPWIGQASLQIAQDRELLQLMGRSGCQGVLIGFESLDAATITDMGKSVNRNVIDYPHAINAFRSHGLAIYATFVFGYDHDTPETFRRTYNFALQHKFFFTAFNHLVPFPGTPLYARLEKEGRLTSPRWWLDPDGRFGDVVFRPAQMSPTDLAAHCNAARHRFYSIPSTLRRALDFRANCCTPKKAMIFLAQNLLHGHETGRRHGLPLGFPERTP